MYYTLNLDTYPSESDFKDGFGYYMVNIVKKGLSELHFYNPLESIWQILSNWDQKD